MIDLGHGYGLRYVGWSPDRRLNPQYDQLPDVERYGAIIRHELAEADPSQLCRSRGYCEGYLAFEGDVHSQLDPSQAAWHVESWDPLTLSPSVACHCGDHGFIRDGRWVPA